MLYNHSKVHISRAVSDQQVTSGQTKVKSGPTYVKQGIGFEAYAMSRQQDLKNTEAVSLVLYKAVQLFLLRSETEFDMKYHNFL